MVLGLGLVAWMRLPALTAREIASAAQHQHASQAATGLAELLHAQRAYGADPALATTVLLPSSGGAAPRDCRHVDCTPQDMAAFQLAEWSSDTAALLPGATARLQCRAARDAWAGPEDQAPAGRESAPRAAAGATRGDKPAAPKPGCAPVRAERVCTLSLRLPGRARPVQWTIRP